MMTILMGRAKSGKTEWMLRRIAALAKQGVKISFGVDTPCQVEPPTRRRWTSAAPAATPPAATPRS